MKKRRAEEEAYDEQKLREEVRYLHSLWLQGPPPPNPNPDPTLKKKRARIRKRTKKTMPPTEPDSASPWQCPAPTPTPSLSGWPTTGAVYPPLTPQDLETHSALTIQLRACKAFKEFCSNSEDDQHEDDDPEDDYWVGRGEEKARFFQKVLEDEELRKYLGANREGGDYCCVVCGANGKGRRFRSCTALAQHSRAMARVETNRSHLAFGQTVCMVLGWDFERLPSAVRKGEPLERSLGNAGTEKLGENVSGVVKDGNGGELVEKDSLHGGAPTDDGKNETILGVIGDDEVKEDDNRDEPVDKAGFEKLQVDDGKCSKEDDKHTNEAKEEDPTEDGDEDEEEDPSEEEEEDPSEDGDEEEDPSEEVQDPTEIVNEDEDNPSEEEDPSEEDENPLQHNDEEEFSSEDGDEDKGKKGNDAVKGLAVSQELEGK